MRYVKEEKQTTHIVGDKRFSSKEEAISAVLDLIQEETVTRYRVADQLYKTRTEAEVTALKHLVEDNWSFATLYEAFEEHFAARFGAEAQKFRVAIEEHCAGLYGLARNRKLWSVLDADGEE